MPPTDLLRIHIAHLRALCTRLINSDADERGQVSSEMLILIAVVIAIAIGVGVALRGKVNELIGGL